MELVIKGSEQKVKRLEKELRLRFKRDGLESTLKQEAKSIEVVEPKIVKAEKPKGKRKK